MIARLCQWRESPAVGQLRDPSRRGTVSPDENAILVLFAGLRDALMPIDYDRIRWWGGWPGQLQELGFMD